MMFEIVLYSKERDDFIVSGDFVLDGL
jgi:hypothetical protein